MNPIKDKEKKKASRTFLGVWRIRAAGRGVSGFLFVCLVYVIFVLFYLFSLPLTHSLFLSLFFFSFTLSLSHLLSLFDCIFVCRSVWVTLSRSLSVCLPLCHTHTHKASVNLLSSHIFLSVLSSIVPFSSLPSLSITTEKLFQANSPETERGWVAGGRREA